MAETENESAPNTAPERPEKEVIEKGIKGMVKWFNVKSGYGFVQRMDTKADLFIHQSEIAVFNPNKSRKSVGENENIEFDVAKGAKGLEAVHVTGPGGAPVQGSRYANLRRGRRGGRPRNFSQSSDRGGRGGYRGGRMNSPYRGRQFENRPFMGYRPNYYEGPPDYGPYPPERMMYYRPSQRRNYYRPPAPGGYYFRPENMGPPPMQRPMNGFRGRWRGPRRGDYSPRERGDSSNMDGPYENEGGRRMRQGQPRRKRKSNRSDTEATETEHGVDGVTEGMGKMAVNSGDSAAVPVE